MSTKLEREVIAKAAALHIPDMIYGLIDHGDPQVRLPEGMWMEHANDLLALKQLAVQAIVEGETDEAQLEVQRDVMHRFMDNYWERLKEAGLVKDSPEEPADADR